MTLRGQEFHAIFIDLKIRIFLILILLSEFVKISKFIKYLNYLNY
jgi:hypothetical protein